MERIAVIGTGRMAPGVAAALANSGAAVRVLGRRSERAALAAERASTLAAANAGSISAGEIGHRMLADAQLVIESISENADEKRELIGGISGWISPQALVATNTSSLRIQSLATALEGPERFIGFHFLNPADSTPVVEVIPGPQTSPQTVDRVSELARAMGKRPLLVRRDVPGFVWNRLQFAVLRECLHLLDEGVADVETLDAAISDGLAPRWVGGGPLATADLGGLSTFAKIASELFGELASGAHSLETISARVEAGKGFYRWTAEQEKAIGRLRRRVVSEASGAIEERRATMPRAWDEGVGGADDPP